MKIDDLLNSTKPILYETGEEEWPYAFSGTCYPVKYNSALFITSAFHCYGNIQIEPEETLYPRPDDPRSFFAFDQKSRAHAEQAADDEHYDHVLLRVARSHHSQAEMDKVVALELADPSNVHLPLSGDVKDLWIRGYPHDAPKHRIDYDLRKISQQAYTTNGCIDAGKAPFAFCYSIRMMTPIPDGMHPNGMSGTPVYGVTSNGRPVYCGMIIRYDEFTGQYIAIGPEILVNGLRQS